jgi:hypothetical protein
MNKSRKWYIALTVVTLFIGIMLGVIIDRCALPHRGGEREHGRHDMVKIRKEIVNHLSKDLSLSPEQRTRLTVILNNSEPEILRIRKEMRKEFMAAHKKVSDQIMDMLDEGQKAKFRKIQEEQQRRMERDRDHDMHP